MLAYVFMIGHIRGSKRFRRIVKALSDNVADIALNNRTGTVPELNQCVHGRAVSTKPPLDDLRRGHRPRPTVVILIQMGPVPQSNQFTLLTSWNTRGAYGDWQRIDFPDGFAFPCGTNLLTGVTLMAWGELRECLRNDGALAVEPQQSATTGASSLHLAVLPHRVSLEPGASSVSHGLTPSNSYIFAWQNSSVEREATNRVDAAFELFKDGSMAITTQPTNGLPTTIYQLPALPPGFVGSGQDTNWLAAAFSPADYAAITNKGYEAWLMEDKVGINEPNGLYKVSITVSQLPDVGPCYLVCGPYKVIVTAPGTYSFPLEVFEHYTARTYPVAVPLSIDYDDGYRGEEPDQGMPCLSPPRLLGVPLIFPPIYDIWQEPRFVITPDHVPLNEAPGKLVSLWCNVSGAVQRYCRSTWRTTKVIFRGSREAEVVEAIIEDEVEFILENAKGSCSATLSITPLPRCCPDCCGDSCHCDGTCCSCNCGCHSGDNSNTNAPPDVSQP